MSSSAAIASEGRDSPAERVLQVDHHALAELIVLELARIGDAKDLGRAACVCKALRAASAFEPAWEAVSKKAFAVFDSVRDSLGAAASRVSWRAHALERLGRPFGGQDSVVSCALADMALLIVDVWHGKALVFSATLTPQADELLEFETYSDSDDIEFDLECKAEFAICNEAKVPGDIRGYRFRGPPFVNARRLRASAWLVRRSDGSLVRVMHNAPAKLDEVAEGSVGWEGSRCVIFRDAPKPGAPVRLDLRAWVIQDETDYRWWEGYGEPRPGPNDAQRITRMRVRWDAAGGDVA